MSKVSRMLMQQQENILAQMDEGEITPEQAISMLAAIGTDRADARAAVNEIINMHWLRP